MQAMELSYVNEPTCSCLLLRRVVHHYSIRVSAEVKVHFMLLPPSIEHVKLPFILICDEQIVLQIYRCNLNTVQLL